MVRTDGPEPLACNPVAKDSDACAQQSLDPRAPHYPHTHTGGPLHITMNIAPTITVAIAKNPHHPRPQ